MRFPRSSGILLHPTSLPGRHGVGDLGPEARRFVDRLVAARQRLWQVLPLGPTGFGNSPYQSASAHAGNPLLIAPDDLIGDGLLTPEDLLDAPAFRDDRVDYGAVIPYKRALLARAAGRFRAHAAAGLREECDAFCRQQAGWLDDYALFMALKEEHGQAVWSDWEPPAARREPRALARWRVALDGPIELHKILQFLFFRQWLALRLRANTRGVRIVGDMPIFVAYDSADVWAHRDLFVLDETGRPTAVAGVPPDYFSATGQLWGNPLYRWDVMAAQGFRWWVERMRTALVTVDIVRIDHFIGLTRYWEVPASAQTAVTGRWLPGPGEPLGRALGAALGPLPVIAEDLGALTPEVEALRDRLELPGMRVLQFAFGGDATNRFLPHHYPRHCVVYTGTHDNDTTAGWFAAAPEAERRFVRRYLDRPGDEIAWDLIRAAMTSVADLVIVPMQDVLGLGTQARMNVPGKSGDFWTWRMRGEEFHEEHAARLAEMAELYDR